MPQHAAILFVNKKHKDHHAICSKLQTMYQVSERSVQSQSHGQCSEASVISEEIKQYNVLIIYLSDETLNNVCISEFMDCALRLGIRIVGIWLDSTQALSLPLVFDSGLYSLSPYSDELIAMCSGEKKLWLDPNGNEVPVRTIKKYTC